MVKMGLSDEDVDKINELVQNCRYMVQGFNVCKLSVLPCDRVIDKGQCTTIIEYMDRRARE